MKLNVTRRVFLAILAANAIIVLCMFLITQWSMDRGFLRYVNQLEQTRMERLAAKLGRTCFQSGGWDFLRKTPETLSQLIGETIAESPMPPPPGSGERRRERESNTENMPVRRFQRFERRIVILDNGRNPLLGSGSQAEVETWQTIAVKGGTVGYLGLLPNKFISDSHQLRFVKEQKLIFGLTAILMLIVSAAISFPLARRLVRPVKKLAAATSLLSNGNFDVRVPVESDDELGSLSRDFNVLALTLGKNESARRQFVADISHELRTPLTILSGEIEAIQDGIQELSQESISSLQAEVIRLSRLVEDLYQLALSDVGALAYRKEMVDLSGILADAVNRARGRFTEKSITLKVSMPEKGIPLFADSDRLAQLFDNLLDNSQKYTDPGGTLLIGALTAGGGVTIDFQDSAPGVTLEERRRLFDRLFRVEGSRNRALGGAGLGLAICRNIVEAHEGIIEALDSPIGGVWIRVSIPLAKGDI
ncbi:MAG: HAMP domain-containing protein [Geobacteraceae bacterium]|nr:HAMP domain-containing protein [Geobacteraceae bacterium]